MKDIKISLNAFFLVPVPKSVGSFQSSHKFIQPYGYESGSAEVKNENPLYLDQLNDIFGERNDILGQQSKNTNSNKHYLNKRQKEDESFKMTKPSLFMERESEPEEHYMIPIGPDEELHVELWPNDRFLSPDAVIDSNFVYKLLLIY